MESRPAQPEILRKTVVTVDGGPPTETTLNARAIARGELTMTREERLKRAKAAANA